jgi:hypothetical protein
MGQCFEYIQFNMLVIYLEVRSQCELFAKEEKRRRLAQRACLKLNFNISSFR